MNSGWPPFPPAGAYDPAGVLQNPGSTQPFPAGTNVPIGCWFAPPNALAWGAGVGGALRQAVWRSPIFDLRPEIRASAPAPPSGRAIGTQAIWKPGGGAGGQLYVQVLGLTSSADALTDIVVTHSENAHVCDPTQMARVIPVEDITQQFSGEIPSALLIFQPPGDGYPVRYWLLELTFAIFIARPDPPFIITAGYY